MHQPTLLVTRVEFGAGTARALSVDHCIHGTPAAEDVLVRLTDDVATHLHRMGLAGDALEKWQRELVIWCLRSRLKPVPVDGVAKT